jgi:prenylcysteine oxidase/farnesylcysteine lyase
METSALMGMNVAQLVLNDYLEVLNNQPTRGEESSLQKALSDIQKDMKVQEL